MLTISKHGTYKLYNQMMQERGIESSYNYFLLLEEIYINMADRKL